MEIHPTEELKKVRLRQNAAEFPACACLAVGGVGVLYFLLYGR